MCNDKDTERSVLNAVGAGPSLGNPREITLEEYRTRMRDADIPKISQSIERLVAGLAEAHINSYKDDHEKYEWLCSEIENMAIDSVAIVEDYKVQGLTIGAIEAEGFMRAMKTLQNLVERINNSVGNPHGEFS